MSTENDTPVESVSDDLDTFSAEFFGQKEAQPEQASPEEDENKVLDDSDASTDATQDDEDNDTLANDEDDETDGDDEDGDEATPDPEPKPKKNRFQERIDELNGKFREEERKRLETERRLDELAKKFEQNDKTTTAPKEAAEDTGPLPNDTNEDGTDKYPLGEFDPNYIKDLTRHTLQQERESYKEIEAKERVQKEMDEQRAVLQSDWNEKLGPAQERYPDFREKGEQLLDTFTGIDQSYGEYLTSTLMSMEFGTDVLYYLANNKDEAQKIVNSGPARATIALGRIEAKFADASEEKQKARPKVSQAPTPPTHVNKGSAPAKPAVEDDTDDLDAFSKKFFKKRK